MDEDFEPAQTLHSPTHPTSLGLAVEEKSSETFQPATAQISDLEQKVPTLEDSNLEQVVTSEELLPQLDQDIRPEVIHHSTSYDTQFMAEALKHAVMSRYLHDPHRRNERVEPVLLSNLSIVERHVTKQDGSDSLMRDIVEGVRMNHRREKFEEVVSPLSAILAHRQSVLSEKIQRLKSEYLELHNNWMEQCAKLDDAAKSLASDETVATTGRTTRRSAANLGDAVRSDLEMEQIIASLGNEDLTDANHLAMRNAAIVPDMISVTHRGIDYLFDDTNNLIEDAADFYAQRTGIDDWTDEEKQTFVEQYAAYPKQFGVIAEALPNKTTAQCVSFYYLHKKKHIDFRKVVQRYAPNKRRRGGRKTDKQRGNALLADIRKHDAEVSSKDTEFPDAGPVKKRRPGRPPNVRKTQVDLTPGTTPTPTATPDPEFVPRSRGGRKLQMRGPVIFEDLTEDEVRSHLAQLSDIE
jgi:Myb-like DNA-binding domain